MIKQSRPHTRLWVTGLVAVSLLSIGSLKSNTNIHADDAQSSNSVKVQQSQELHFVDKDSGKVVGTQNLMLNQNGTTFADNTKLKLPSGYQRTDDFTYDLNSGNDDSDLHYSKDKDGKTVWNVFVSKNDDDQVKGRNGKQIVVTVADTDKDGKTETTTVTISPKGNTTSTSDYSSDQIDSSSNSDSDDKADKSSSSTTNSNDDSSGSSDKSSNDSSSDGTKSDTQTSNANSSSKASDDNSEGSSNGGSSTGTGSSNDATSASSKDRSSSSSSSSPQGAQSSSANSQGQTPANTGNGNNQSLPQTGMKKHSVFVQALINTGNWLANLMHL